MANTTTLTKELNGNVLVNLDGTEYSLMSNYRTRKNETKNSVTIESHDGSKIDEFNIVDVEKVVRDDGTEIFISDVDTLFTELHTNFFFDIRASKADAAHDIQSFELPAEDNTTSATFVDVQDFKITTKKLKGNSGSYLISFEIDIENTTNGSINIFRFVVDGTPTGDEFTFVSTGANRETAEFSVGLAENVSNNKTAQLQWKTDSGLLTMNSGSILLHGTPTNTVI